MASVDICTFRNSNSSIDFSENIPPFLKDNFIPQQFWANPYSTHQLSREEYINKEFVELTKGIDSTLKSQIERDFVLSKAKSRLKVLLALESGDLLHKSLKDLDKMAGKALFAVKRGVIDRNSFATLMFVRSALKNYSNVNHVPLLDDAGDITAEADRLFNSMNKIIMLKSDPRSCFIKNETYLKTEQMARFYALIKQLPSHERFLLTTPDLETFEENCLPGKKCSLSLRVIQVSCVSFLNRATLTKNGENYHLRVIPSFGLMNCLIQAQYGEKSIKLNPVVGVSSLTDFVFNGLYRHREFRVGFPGCECPESGDGHIAKFFDFMDHELFHGLNAASLDTAFQQTIIAFALLLNSLEWVDEDEKAFALSWYKRLIDMEIIDQRTELKKFNPPLSPEGFFWDTFIFSTSKTLNIFSAKNPHLSDGSCLQIRNKVVFRFVSKLFEIFKNRPEYISIFGIESGLVEAYKKELKSFMPPLSVRLQLKKLSNEERAAIVETKIFSYMLAYPFLKLAQQMEIIVIPVELLDSNAIANKLIGPIEFF